MLYLPNLLLVGGTAQNSGKTALVCQLLQHFAPSSRITAVKLSAYTKTRFRQHHLHNHFTITRETNTAGTEDTSRMLQSGAHEAYHIIMRDDFIEEAVKTFSKDTIIICESNTLRKVVKPGIFIMLRKKNTPIKPSASDVIKYADKIFFTGKNNPSFDISDIQLTENGWSFK